MNEKEHKAEQAIQGASFSWGSFQYDDAAELYTKLCKEEAENGRDEVLVKYGIKVGKVQLFEGDVLEGFKNSLCVDILDPEVIGDDTSEVRKLFEGATTVTKMLNFLAAQAWDLWSGAPYIATTVFPELDLGEIYHEHTTGAICWLLKSYGFVEDDEPFKGWDT